MPIKEYFYPKKKFDLNTNLLKNFNTFQSSYNTFLSSLSPYISIIPVTEINQENSIERNSIFFDKTLYESSIFNMDSEVYKYRGFVELKSVDFEINDVIINGRFTEGNIQLTIASSFGFEKIQEFLQPSNTFIMKIGYVDKNTNEISENDYLHGMGLPPMECTVQNFNSNENNGVWDVSIEFIASLFHSIFKIPLKLFGPLNCQLLKKVYLIPKVNNNELAILRDLEARYDEKTNTISSEKYGWERRILKPGEKLVVQDKENISNLDFERDFYVNMMEFFELIKNNINSQYIKNQNDDILFDFLYGNSDSTELYKYSEKKSNEILVNKNNLYNEVNNDENGHPIVIYESPTKITITSLSSIYIPFRYFLIKYIKSSSLNQFLDSVLNWVNNKYDVYLIYYVSYDCKYINIINVFDDILNGVSKNIPILLKNSSKSIVRNSSFDVETPIDEAFLMAYTNLKSNTDQEMVLYNLNIVFDNIEIFSSNIFVPISFSSGEQTESNTAKQIIIKYKLSNEEQKKEIRKKYGNKLIFFKQNQSPGKGANISEYTIKNSSLIELKQKGLLNNILFFKNSKGAFTLVGNGFFEPLSDLKIYFDQNKNFIYNGTYSVESIKHSLQKNKWDSILNVSRINTFQYDVLSEEDTEN